MNSVLPSRAVSKDALDRSPRPRRQWKRGRRSADLDHPWYGCYLLRALDTRTLGTPYIRCHLYAAMPSCSIESGADVIWVGNMHSSPPALAAGFCRCCGKRLKCLRAGGRRRDLQPLCVRVASSCSRGSRLASSRAQASSNCGFLSFSRPLGLWLMHVSLWA